MLNIVTVSGTSRPDNYTAKALAIVNDELTRRECPPTVFDARDLSLSFPGQSPTDDAQRLRSVIEASIKEASCESR